MLGILGKRDYSWTRACLTLGILLASPLVVTQSALSSGLSSTTTTTTTRPTTTTTTTRPGTVTKTTIFTLHQRAYIEGRSIDCTKFADDMKGLWFLNLQQWSLAFAFCQATINSFPETSATNPARLNETASFTVVCEKVGNGPWNLKSSTAAKPICSMGSETLGPPSGEIVVGTGVMGNCIATAQGSAFSAFIDGQPPMHLDLGLQLVKNRACTAIRIGISGTFGCSADGTATFTGQTSGTNFPSLYWSLTRAKPDGTFDSKTKNQSQTNMANLWQCNGGNMASGTKGQLSLP